MTRACILMLLLALLPAASSGAEPVSPITHALAERIMECRHQESGAILLGGLEPRPGGLVPYFGHFGAYGLLRAYEAMGDPRYLEAADRWVDFYRGRMAPDGTVTDFTFTPDDTFVGTGDMDSTDSYAALYLWVIAERVRVTREDDKAAEWLLDHELSCHRTVSAILLTLQDSGMTLAKPDYPIEYLMDNAEVITGLRSAQEAFLALGNTGAARWADRQALVMETELRTFYDDGRGYYAYYRDLAGDKGYALDKWYPDIMAQVLFVMRVGRPQEPDYGLIDRIWQQGLIGEFDPDEPLRFIWLGLAAQRVGHTTCADAVIKAVNQLPPEQVTRWDVQACASALELLTGGTRP